MITYYIMSKEEQAFKELQSSMRESMKKILTDLNDSDDDEPMQTKRMEESQLRTVKNTEEWERSVGAELEKLSKLLNDSDNEDDNKSKSLPNNQYKIDEIKTNIRRKKKQMNALNIEIKLLDGLVAIENDATKFNKDNLEEKKKNLHTMTDIQNTYKRNVDIIKREIERMQRELESLQTRSSGSMKAGRKINRLPLKRIKRTKKNTRNYKKQTIKRQYV